MRNFSGFILFFFLAFLGFATSALTADRVALVIGNAGYNHVPVLANPQNDAKDMAAKLRSLGFEVVEGYDLELAGIRESIGQFVSKMGGAKLALFFYAGHGLQVNGQNYLIPVDANLKTSLDLEFEAVPIDLVLSAMENLVETSILFLDACRDNPMARSLARSMGKRSSAIGRGLARLGAGSGTLISFATQPGNVALDGTGRNSPFTSALVRHLGNPGDSLADSMIRVRNTVIKMTGGKQVPWEHSSLTGRIVLQEKASEQKPEPTPAPAVNAISQNAQLTVELAFWDSVKNAQASYYFETYLRRYPNGLFAEIAKLKIADIENAKAEKELNEQTETRQGSVPATPPAVAETAASPQPQTSPAPTKPEGAELPKKDAAEETQLAALPEKSEATVVEPAFDPLAQITERSEIREIQEKLWDLNFNPGKADGVMGRKTRTAIRQYQSEYDLPSTGQATRGLLEGLRKTTPPGDWAAIGFLASRKQIFDRKNLSSREQAETAIKRDCRRCNDFLVFSGGECGALAMSDKGWGWAVRKSEASAENATLDACAAYGSGCKIQISICTKSE